MRRQFQLFSLLALLFLTVALPAFSASAEPTPIPSPIPVSSIRLSADGARLQVGGVLAVRAEVQPANATNPLLAWRSSDVAVATVDRNGLVTGVAMGDVQIVATATDGSGVFGTLDLSVDPVLVQKLTLSYASKTLRTGARWPIRLAVEPANATNPSVSFLSTDERVARVEVGQDGALTLIAGDTCPASAAIVVVARDGSGVYATCDVSVRTPITDVLLATRDEQRDMVKGDTLRVYAATLPSDASQELLWLAEDPTACTLSQDAMGAWCDVTALKAGECSLKAVAQDGSGVVGVISLNVQVPLEGVSLPEASHVFLDRTLQLSPVYEPTDTTFRVLRWSVADPAIASIDENGVVRGLAVGTTYVVAQSARNPDILGISTLQVTKPVREIALTASVRVIGIGGALRVSAAVSPYDATNPALCWESSNPSVVTVDAQGMLTGCGVGKALIYATAADGGGAVGALSVEISASPTAVVLPEALYLAPGERYKLTPRMLPDGLLPGHVTWSSDDALVAAIDENGLVTGVFAGTTNIRVKTDVGLTAICRVTVQNTLSGIALFADGREFGTNDVLELDLGATTRLRAEARPIGIDAALRFSVAKGTSVELDPAGTLRGLKRGVSVLRVDALTFDGSQATTRTLKVRVVEPVDTVQLPESVSILVGRKRRIEALVLPRDATDTALFWDVGSERVALVDSKGVVQGVSVGETLLTATSLNGKVGICRIRVLQPVTEITIRPIETVVCPGEQLLLTADVQPESASAQLRWSSSKPGVAAVTQSGRLLARKPGKTKLTATAMDGSGITCSYTLVVEPLVEALHLEPREMVLYANGAPNTLKLKLKVKPAAAAKRPVLYLSSDTRVATVSENGLVTAVAAGAATIEVQGENATVDRMALVVRDLPTYIQLETSEITLALGQKYDLARRVVMDGTEPKVTYGVSGKAVQVNREGVLTAKRVGAATVKVKSVNGLTALLAVRVVAASDQTIYQDSTTDPPLADVESIDAKEGLPNE